jgi:cytochrome c-type biogenesis protein CcmF
MTVLGHWLVVVALASGVGAAVMYFWQSIAGEFRGFRPFILVLVSLGGVVFSSLVLLILFLQHDYSNGYVFSYSDRTLPLHFLVSSFYAGQEGSFLFWALCLSILGVFLARSARKRGNEAPVMATFMLIQSVFLVLVLAKSPFRYVWEMFPEAPAGVAQPDGRGLNPLLQNFWMVIHPPVLFLGFAAMAVPFSLAIAGLWKNDFKILVRQGFAWVHFGTLILGLGIMLGAYWAYGVLGWGGYWGWDPVENSSLVPWLTGVALIHTMIAQLRTGKYVRTNLALAVVTFWLVVYSTFLTRSGILGDASVHAFTDPGSTVYWILLSALAAILLAGIALILVRWKNMGGAKSDTSFFTRETALGAGTIVMVLSAAVVLFGTSLPILSKIRVEPSFYDSTNLPIAIAVGLLIGLSLYSGWEYQEAKDLFMKALRAFSVSVIAGIVLFLAGVRDVELLLLGIACIFAIIVNVEIAVTVNKGDWRFLGGKIAHAGIALFLLGVLASGKYATTERVALEFGRSKQVLGRTFTFNGVREREDKRTVFSVQVNYDGNNLTLEPVMFDTGMEGMLKNPDIASGVTKDLYVSPLSYDEAKRAGSPLTLRKGESVALGEHQVQFADYRMDSDHSGSSPMGGAEMKVGTVINIVRGNEREEVTPYAVIQRGKPWEFSSVHSRLLDADLRLTNLGSPEEGQITVNVEQAGLPGTPAVLVVDASIKPFINLVWFGTVILLTGFGFAIVKRKSEGDRA